jgi:hypothetical protein
MGETFGRDLIRGAHLPPVPDLQRTPVQSADATRAIPPRDTGGEREFPGSMPVGPVRLNLAADLPHPVAAGTRPRVLVMEQRDESLSCRQQLASARQGVTGAAHTDVYQIRLRRARVR